MPAVAEARVASLSEIGVDSLSPKEQAFLRYMAEDPNLDHVKAATRAGYKRPNIVGCQLLKHPKMAKLLAQMIRQAMTGAVMTKQESLEELTIIARQDLADFVDENNDLLPLHLIDPRKRRAIRKYKNKDRVIKQEDGTEITIKDQEIETWSKDTALYNFFKHYKLLTDDPTVQVQVVNLDWSTIKNAKSTGDVERQIQDALAGKNPIGITNVVESGQIKEVLDGSSSEAVPPVPGEVSAKAGQPADL